MSSSDILNKGRELISQNPSNPEGWSIMTQYYMSSNGKNINDVKKGLPYFKKLVIIEKSDKLFFDYSLACRWISNYNEALWGINEALELCNDNIRYLGHKGFIIYNMGQQQEGLKYVVNAVKAIEDSNKDVAMLWDIYIIQDFINFFDILCGIYSNNDGHKAEAIRLAKIGLTMFPPGMTDVLKKYTNISHNEQQNNANTMGEKHFAKGLEYEQNGDLHSAASEFIVACKYAPNSSGANYAASTTLRHTGKHELALEYATRAHNLDPNNMIYITDVLHLLKATCRWEEFSEKYSIVKKLIEENDWAKIINFRFSGMYWGFDMKLLYKLFTLAAKELKVRIEKQYRHDKNQDVNKKLKIAYVSSNYRNHAQGSQLGTFFQCHDRINFEVFAISLYPAIVSTAVERRDLLKKNVDHWIDAHDLDDKTIAKIIKDHGIDIVVDLCGWADHPKIEIFAHRPAPVQISFLGYPGTTGTDFMDYYIGDPYCTPPSMHQYFSEKLFIMPHSYQITEHKGEHEINTFFKPLTKSTKIIFCNFNQPVKIEHKLFTVWMNILKKVEGSVLWLLKHTAADNMKTEAKKQGVDPDRLIFQENIDKREHLKRLQSADLLLDTTIYNAHTSAGDALWAGLPILTILGDTMASRVCSGMLASSGLTDLITGSFEEYEEIAIDLGNNPNKLFDLKKRIRDRREKMVLFDTEQYVADLEKGMREVWRQFVECDSFSSFNVSKV